MSNDKTDNVTDNEFRNPKISQPTILIYIPVTPDYGPFAKG